MKQKISALAGSLSLVFGAAQAQPRPTVVELFSSEGCSSCPPAEALIGTLSQRRSDVIALAFHVDYWDYIGWHDRFEIPEAVERQQRYAHALKIRSVYTPQLVIDGRRDIVGGDDPNSVPISADAQLFSLGIDVRQDQIEVSLGAAQTGAKAGEVVLISYLPEASSNIKAGENAGKELREFNIVRSIRSLGIWKGDATSFRVPLTSLPHDATHVAVLVQTADQGPILGAAMRAVR